MNLQRWRQRMIASLSQLRIDSAVQFYDLSDVSGVSVLLPGANWQNSTASGGDIEFDPINKLVLVAQEFFDGSLTDGSGIQVYDLAGNLVESLDGLNFQGGFNVFSVHITPQNRFCEWSRSNDSDPVIQLLSRFGQARIASVRMRVIAWR